MQYILKVIAEFRGGKDMIWSKPTACWREKITDTVMNTSVVSKNTTVCVQIVKIHCYEKYSYKYFQRCL